MTQVIAFFWNRLAQWLDSRSLGSMAETCYRFAGDEGGKHGATALLQLGKKLIARGELQQGLDANKQAVRGDPANPATWCGLGAAHRQLDQFEEARRCYDRALELDPSNLHALTNTGELYLRQGDPAAGLKYFDRVLDQSPLQYEALCNRIAALARCDKLTEAEQACAQAIEQYPDSAALQVNLGSVFMFSGQTRPALIAFSRALELDPDNDDAQFNLAVLKGDPTTLKDAVKIIRSKMKQEGESAPLQLLLAIALHFNAQLTEAEVICRKLLERYPTNAEGWNTLALIFDTRGDSAQTFEHFQKALEYQPKSNLVFSNVVFQSTHLPNLTPEERFKLHRDWAERFELPLLEKQFQHLPGKETEKQLKIGYLSGDFHSHPVGYLLRSVLQQHDHRNFEIHGFSTGNRMDGITEILRAHCDSWHDARLMSLDELARLIKAQGIDILVDLSGHTGDNRLPAFALKPAPVQATWIGYFHSTGLKSIDYFITDPYTTPLQSAQLFSETPAWLPHSRFCYTPHTFTLAVSRPPFEKTGYITFGSFNRLSKLTDSVIDAWSRVLINVPGARLMIKARELGDAETVERLKNRFAVSGLAPERLIVRPGSSVLQTYQAYAEMDIALDPFPFNGGMTTLDALWMGVPVVTLTGDSIVSRQSTAMLVNIGLDELIFKDVESYIAGAIALALDAGRVARLRSIVRRQMSHSPLCDAEQFTQDLELLYRRMWQAWCRGEKLGAEVVAAPPVAKKTVLHVGCGPTDIRDLPSYFHKRWKEVRFDIDPDAYPDVVGSALDMSAVQTGSMDAVYSSHMLEHLYAHDLRTVLAEMKRVLKPDGLLVATVPDLQEVARLIAADQLLDTAYESPAGSITPFDMVYGHRGYIEDGKVYMAHRGGFTLTTLVGALREAGFAAVSGKRRVPVFDLWALAIPVEVADDQLQELATAVLPE